VAANSNSLGHHHFTESLANVSKSNFKELQAFGERAQNPIMHGEGWCGTIRMHTQEDPASQ
jgi:hypothetical protein